MRKKRARKRGNGTGSVYRRGDVAGKPWVAVAPARRGVRERIASCESAREAREALDGYLRAPVPASGISMTFADVYAEWSAGAFPGLSRQTAAGYRAAYMKFSEVHARRFRDLRAAHYQACFDRCAGMSQSTLNKMRVLLNRLYRYAVSSDIVPRNYAQSVVLPRKARARRDCFTDVEVEKLARAAGTVAWADVILLLCYTGWRISELLALTPMSYDAATRTLTGGMKTEAGTDRTVPVHPRVQPILDAWLAKGGERIICTEDGQAMTADRFRKHCWYPALEQTGIRRLPPHAARHTFATRLSAAGARPEHIQALAGHVNFTTTANVYIHASLDALRGAVNLLA